MNLIVAVDKNWGIGKDNHLLASLPGDMKYFKEQTMGKVVVMGRRTYESIPGGKGLPKRTNIVMTSNTDYSAEGAIVVHNEQELFDEIKNYDAEDVFLIGGASLYNKYYKICDKLYITKINADLGADTFITNIDEDSSFEIISESESQSDNGIEYKFLIYERK